MLLSVKIRVQTTDRVRLRLTVYLTVFEAEILQNSVQQYAFNKAHRVCFLLHEYLRGWVHKFPTGPTFKVT